MQKRPSELFSQIERYCILSIWDKSLYLQDEVFQERGSNFTLKKKLQDKEGELQYTTTENERNTAEIDALRVQVFDKEKENASLKSQKNLHQKKLHQKKEKQVQMLARGKENKLLAKPKKEDAAIEEKRKLIAHATAKLDRDKASHTEYSRVNYAALSALDSNDLPYLPERTPKDCSSALAAEYKIAQKYQTKELNLRRAQANRTKQLVDKYRRELDEMLRQ